MPQKFIEKMGADEVEALAEQVKAQEAIINDIPLEDHEEGASHLLQDTASLERSVKRGRRILERDAMLVPTTPLQKDAIRNEIKRLIELVVIDMPTVKEMNYPLGSEESERAVRKNLAFQNKWTPTMLRIKDLQRRLEPDDPLAGNLERIRPK